jgi:ABC-type uncharacterized transport system YnjBCD permease subunit
LDGESKYEKCPQHQSLRALVLLYLMFFQPKPGWRNWQTQRTQNPYLRNAPIRTVLHSSEIAAFVRVTAIQLRAQSRIIPHPIQKTTDTRTNTQQLSKKPSMVGREIRTERSVTCPDNFLLLK